jgi:hypothetical protein
MDNKLPFKDCVDAIQKACQTNQINDEAAIAFLNIDHQLSQNMGSSEYQTFQKLDLSSILSSLPKRYPQLLDKVFEDPKIGIFLGNISKLTTFRLMQGILAQHNKSVTYNEGEESFFKNVSDNSLGIDKEFTRFKADYVLSITGFCNPEAYAQQQHFIADLLEQEICLRNNHNAKTGKPIIYQAKVIYTSKNQKKDDTEINTCAPSTQEQSLEQSKIPTDLTPVQQVTENNQQVTQQEIAQPTEAVVTTNNQPATDSISSNSQTPTPTPKEPKLQQPTQKDQKKEAQFTTPLSKRTLFLSGIGICAFIALFYHEQLRILLTNFYSTL